MTQDWILILSNALTGVAGWFVGRKRQQAETDNQVLRNLELSIALYKQIIDDLKDEMKGDITAVVFQPNQKIYRWDAETNSPYFVFIYFVLIFLPTC